jgi:hypothetical protein
MKATYNIGMNNNPVDLDRFFDNLSKMGLIIRHRFDNGEYLDNPEPTCIPVLVSVREFDPFYLAETFCLVMKQDCIAVKVEGGESRLVYNPNFTGEKMEFDGQYFIDF